MSALVLAGLLAAVLVGGAVVLTRWRERFILRSLAAVAEDWRAVHASELIAVSGGLLRSGTIYVHLQRLEDRGLIRGWEEPAPRSGLTRRVYRITDTGRRVVRGEQP